MATLIKRTYTKTDPKTGQRVRRKTKKWYGQFVDADGTTKRVPLCTDKSAAQAMLAELVKSAERKQAGIIDESVEQGQRPLREHLEDFRRYLAGENNTAKHVSQTCNRVMQVIEGCQIAQASDLSPAKIVEWLAGQRQNGKFGIKTSNYYLSAVKEFCNWLVKNRRASNNPLRHVSALNADGDVRRQRRALTPAEIQRVIDAAADGKTIEGVSGSDRALLYLLANCTGLRRGELASLTRQSFDLNAETPTVTVEAAYSKRRRKDMLPLHPAIMERLREWLEGKKTTGQGVPLLPVANRKTAKTAKMMRLDLNAARDRWINEAETESDQSSREESDFLRYRDSRNRIADFHANRHTFITNLGKAGVNPKTAQTLARHSDINLTMGIYSHVELADQAAAVRSLPAFPCGSNGEPEPDRLALRLALIPHAANSATFRNS